MLTPKLNLLRRYLLIAFCFLSLYANAQLCPECDINCILCEDIDGFSGNNGSNSAGVGPGTFCTIIQHQMLWLGFVAASEDLSVEVEVELCSGGELEVGLFEATDCSNFNLISNCFGGANGNPIGQNESGVVSANQSLEIGQYYFLVFDMTSNIPANCDFTLSVIEGETGASDLDEVAILEGPEVLCDGEDFEYIPELTEGGANFNWEVNGMDMGEGLSYDFSDDEEGSYLICATPFNYCSEGPQVCTIVQVDESYEEYYLIQACYEECAFFQGEMYCTDRDRDFEYETVYGCDSIIYLEIEWYNDDSEYYLGEFKICEGQDFEYEGQKYNQSGTYYVTLEGSHECDSIIEFDLQIMDTIFVLLFDSICQGEVYLWNQDSLFNSGVYTDTLFSVNGCDSITTLNLKVLESYESYIQESICSDQKFEISDTMLSDAGEYEFVLASQNGCDSIIFLSLTISDTIFVYYFENICEGEIYSFGDSLYSDPGIYHQEYVSVQSCDSIEILELNLFYPSETLLNEWICQGEILTVGGEDFSYEGNYEIIVSNQLGCDSIIALNLLVLDSIIERSVYSLCEGDSVSIYGQYFYEEGSYKLVGLSSSGCDSIIYAELEFYDTIEERFSIEICDGETLEFGNSIYTEDGIYIQNYISAYGCDSTIVIELKVLDIFRDTLIESLCNGEAFIWDSETFLIQGDYDKVFTSQNGCDSIVQLQLIVFPESDTMLFSELCNNDSIFFIDSYLNTEGIYMTKLENKSGCDSTVVLDLRFNDEILTEVSDSFCQLEQIDFNGQIINSTGSYIYNLTAENGCDSTIVLQAYFEDCSIDYTLLVESVKCNSADDGIITIDINEGVYPVAISWFDAITLNLIGEITLEQNVSQFIIQELASGTYNIVFIDALGETIEETVFVSEPDLLQINAVISNYNGYQTSCNSIYNAWFEGTVSGGNPPYSELIWSDGYLGDNRDSIDVGNYFVSAADAKGCTVEYEFIINEPEPLEYLYSLDIINACESNSAVITLETSGGVEPTSFEIYDSQGFQSIENVLNEGNNTLIVLDINGCELKEEIEIPRFEPLSISLGQDIVVNQYELIEIVPIIDFAYNYLEWSSDAYIEECMACESLQFSVDENVVIYLEVFNENNCSVRDTLQITVIEEFKVYIPNVITTASQYNNDKFNVFFSETTQIVDFEIYSRWGDLIYSNNNVVANDKSQGWDGYYNGKKAEQGVYVYKIIYLNKEGAEVLLIGSLSLLH